MDISTHPCFNDKARHTHARLHLPVAPKCNIQCRYCDRRGDCPNESRPGLSSKVLSPGQALHYVHRAVERQPETSVVGIAGPGDPFANAEATLETLRRVRGDFPGMLLCVASNGLAVGPHVEELARLEVSHVTLTINAVDPGIGKEIYAWVRDGWKVLRGIDAAGRLLERQLAAISAIKAHDVVVKVNTIVIPGVNEDHVEDVASTCAALGADIQNLIPLYPVEGTDLAGRGTPDKLTMFRAQGRASRHMKLMSHCTRCRADAAGLLGESMEGTAELLREASVLPVNPGQAADRRHVAVATREGLLVNRHLGEADELVIYEADRCGVRLLETRTTPAPGGGQARWKALGELLADCRAVLVNGAGDTPRQTLESGGLAVRLVEGLIEEEVPAAFHGEAARSPVRPRQCGEACSGTGGGCG